MAGNHFSIDYYQREYKWETKQVLELLNYLATKFLGDYEESHSRREVAGYGHYLQAAALDGYGLGSPCYDNRRGMALQPEIGRPGNLPGRYKK